MAGAIRLALRVAALFAATLGFYALRLVSVLFTFAFPRMDSRAKRLILKRWARTCARIVGMRVSVIGPLPMAPFFLVSNHLTYLDVLTLTSQLGCVFVAKSEVAHWPLLGFLMKQMNVIFVDRLKRNDTVRVNGLIAQTIAGGEAVVMFPESTTSRGDDVRPFKTALFESAAENGFPVHCAAIHYAALPGAPPASEWITWWTPISFGAHAGRVLRHRGLNAVVTFGETPISGADRKLLAEEAHAAVQALFIPVA